MKGQSQEITELHDFLMKMRINEGWTNLDIFQYLKDQGFSDPAATYHRKKINDRINELASIEYSDMLKERIAQFEKLYLIAVKNKNIRDANNILKEIGKLEGHYVERVHHSGEIATPSLNIILKTPDEPTE